MDRLELHISYKCLNKCIFCSEFNQINKFKNQFVEKEKIIFQLRKLFKRGFGHVTFTGGEPTYHPDFSEIVELAKKIGYKIYISTNGGLFSSVRFCQKTLPNIDEISFSIHGHNRKLHNFHTRNNQSFNRLSKALYNINKGPGETFCFINIVLTQYNLLFIENIIRFASKYKKVKQVLVSNIAPEGNGLNNFSKLAVPLKIIERKISGIIKLAENKGLNIRFFGVPLCLLKNYINSSNDVHWSPRLTIEKWGKGKGSFLKKTLSYKPIRKRIKTNNCKWCSKKNICGGLFKEYYLKFNDGELEPFIEYSKSKDLTNEE